MDKAFEKQIIDLENQYWRAMKDMDVDAALRLTDEPCIITGAQGVARIDKAAYRKMMSGGRWKIIDFSFSDIAVHQVSDDVAVIGYKVHEKLTVDGKPVDLDAADASTWVRRNGAWVCAMHTESILGDPFGSDRSRTGPRAPTE